MFSEIGSWFPQGSALSVRLVGPSGLVTQTLGPMGGREMALSVVMAPLMMGVRTAMPAIVRARQQAREAVAINFLRMVESAKEQWALEHNKEDGAAVTLDDLRPYLKPDDLQVPEGFELLLNPIGENPALVKPDGSKITLY